MPRQRTEQIPEFLYDQFPSEITFQSLHADADSPYASLSKDPNASGASNNNTKTGNRTSPTTRRSSDHQEHASQRVHQVPLPLAPQATQHEKVHQKHRQQQRHQQGWPANTKKAHPRTAKLTVDTSVVKSQIPVKVPALPQKPPKLPPRKVSTQHAPQVQYISQVPVPIQGRQTKQADQPARQQAKKKKSETMHPPSATSGSSHNPSPLYNPVTAKMNNILTTPGIGSTEYASGAVIPQLPDVEQPLLQGGDSPPPPPPSIMSSQQSQTMPYDSRRDSFEFEDSHPAITPGGPATAPPALQGRALVKAPETLTLPEVEHWLRQHKFNDTWVEVFHGSRIERERFGALESYDQLKRYLPFLDTSDSYSKAERFIQLLHKDSMSAQENLHDLLRVPTSPSGISTSSPQSTSTSPLTPNSIQSSREPYIDEFEAEDPTHGPALVPVVSAPAPPKPRHEEDDAFHNYADDEQLVVARNKPITKPRPVSTIENPTYEESSAAAGSFSPPIVRRLTRRRHKKTTSPDSSFDQSEPDTPSAYSAHHQRAASKGSLSDNATTPKGIFNKFFGKSRTELSYQKAVKNGEESPISPVPVGTPIFSAASDLKRKKSTFDVERKRISTLLGDYGGNSPVGAGADFLRRRSTFKKNKPSFEKIGPVGKKPSPAGVTIPVITTSKLHSNTNTVSLSATNIRKAKELSASASILRKPETPYYFVDEKYRPKRDTDSRFVLITSDNETFTAVDVTDISTVEDMKDKFSSKLGFSDGELARFYLTDYGCSRGLPLDDTELTKLVDSQFFSGVCMVYVQPLTNYKNTIGGNRVLPSTPKNVSLEEFPDPSRMSSTQQYRRLSPSVSKRNKNRSPSITRARSITTTSSGQDPESTLSSGHSFKVIQQDRKEIDFDKHRASPYSTISQGDSLVALRSAPLPPLKGDKDRIDSDGGTSPSKNKSSKSSRKPPPAIPAETIEEMERRNSFRQLMSLERKGTIRRRKTGASVRSRFDPFGEHEVDFGDAPELESEDGSETESGSDDDLFAKVPTKPGGGEKLHSVISTGSESLLTVSSSDSSLDIRPPAEVVYDNLDRYFPNADLDKIIIDEVVSPPVSPDGKRKSSKKAEDEIEGKKRLEKKKRDAALAASNESNIHRMKSIRIVAEEAKRQSTLQTRRRDGSLVRRQSTKMWGQPVIEVIPGTGSDLYVNKLRERRGMFKQFAWVKGELIGVGTFGKVYLGLNVTTGDMIAVKQTTISPKFLNRRETKDMTESFKAEVETLKDLDHENIVQYLGFGRKANTYNIFLEYVSGGSVGHLIRSYGAFDERLIRYLTRQILEGLCYIHSKGILHRDLKADNLLLETDGICKISDFGISKKSKDIYSCEAAMTFQGTVFWMAPEIIDSQSHKGYNAKVDIWALGCVVLEMFAGKRPWHDYAMAAAIFKLGNKSAPPISDETRKNMSDEGYQFLQRCFEIDPEKRPTAKQLLQDPFCEEDETFDFEKTELAKKMKFEDAQDKKRLDMMRRSARA